jgi:hypothetical protein
VINRSLVLYLIALGAWPRTRQDILASSHANLQKLREYTKTHRVLKLMLFDDGHLTIHNPPGEIRLRVLYDPVHHDWETVKDVILEEARRQRDEIRAELAQQDFLVIDTEPALDRHIHWLYLRICPQKDFGRPLGWDAIAQRENVTIKTVKKFVLPLAHDLGLSLPRLSSRKLSLSR